MRKSSWLVIILIVLLSAGLAAVKIASRPVTSDEEQIHAVLAKGQIAVEEKDLKGAMACVSTSYKDPSGVRFEQLRIQAIQAFQQEGKYSVTLEGTAVKISDDTAEVKSLVTVGLQDKGAVHEILRSPITIRFAKEESRRRLIWPVKTWRITSIQGVPSAMGE